VDTLTLIQCSKIDTIVQPSVFPRLKTIHYLSAPPTHYARIPGVTWTVPSLSHPFYQGLIEAGIGYADDGLISRYITRINYAEDGMETGLWIPDYGVIDADMYRYYVNQYMLHQQDKNNGHYPFTIYHETLLKQHFMKRILPGYSHV
jgi:hypothetical protein